MYSRYHNKKCLEHRREIIITRLATVLYTFETAVRYYHVTGFMNANIT